MSQNNATNQVTTVVHHRVKLDMVDDYRRWQQGISDESRKFAGFIDIQVIEPGIVTDANNEFVIIFSFKNNDLLEKWLNSPQRKKWLDKADEFSCGEPMIETFEGLAHWFKKDQSVPTWKMTFVSFLAIWPLVHFMSPPIQKILNLSPFMEELITTFVITIAMSYVALPLMSRIFNRWLKA